MEAGDDDALSSESGTTKKMLTVAFSWSPDASLSPICILFKRTLKDHSIRHLNSFFGFFFCGGKGLTPEPSLTLSQSQSRESVHHVRLELVYGKD